MLKCCKPYVLAFHTVLSRQFACKKTRAERAPSLTQTASHGDHPSKHNCILSVPWLTPIPLACVQAPERSVSHHFDVDFAV